MANISSQFKRASELYQRAVQQYQVKQKEQRALIDQFKVGDQNTKVKLKPQLIALHQDMQHHQELVDRAEAAFEKALAGEPVNLGEDTIVKNKKTGNVYSVKKANPAIHTKPSASDIAQAKASNGGDVKAEPKADGMATVNGIASTTGLRAQAVAGWADENGVNLSKVADDLKSKKLKPMDFMTAVVGNPGNKYAKDIIAKYSQKSSSASNMGVDSVVYNTRTKTVGIVRMGDERGETKTDADGNVNTDELEPYNPMKYPHQKDAKAAPSTSKEIDARGLWKPFSQSGTEPTKGPELDVDKQSHIKDIPQKFRSMVSMKIDQLAKAADEAKAKGEKAPNFNLCDITIPGTNLYCKGNKGIPREDMPQFKGYAKPGSIADKLPKNNDGEVDTESQFKVLLKRNGVAVSEPQEVPADQLKATQTELVGAKVAGMTKALETEPNHPKITAPIYVSNDGYVLDGHHRWAAVTSSAVASGKPAMMNVRVIDMPIKDLVKISNDFADQIGIQQKKADANAEAPKKEVTEVTTNDWHFKKILQMWDKANPFGKKKIGTVLCRNPRASRNDIIAAMRDSDYKEITHFTDKLHIESVVMEDTDTSTIIKDLDKVRHDLIKKVDVLISKKKKLYANVDITTPMSADEKQLDKDIQSIFSQIQSIIQQKRKIKTENVVVENEDTVADESRMAMSGIKTAIESANNIQQIFNSKGEEFDVPAWVQSYLALASDYLHSINEYYNGIENK
jgi:hypothetical protein